MILAAIHKTVTMFVALHSFASYEIPTSAEYCREVQVLMEKNMKMRLVVPEIGQLDRPLAILCIDPAAGE